MAQLNLDAARMADIHAKQSYQEKLDAYRNAEETRLRKQANFRKQTVIGVMAFALVWGFFNFVMPESPASIYILPIFGGMVFLMILAFLGTLRPNTKPVEPTQ